MDSPYSKVEEVIVRWLLEEHQVSNVALAHLSNLSHRWRFAVQQVLLSDAISSNLLLPSIIKKIREDRDISMIEAEEIGKDEDLDEANTSSSLAAETFCVAWFAGEGIKQLPIASTNALDDSRRGQYYYDDNPSNHTRMRQRSRNPTPMQPRDRTHVCYEWQGYETPWEVLRLFRYSSQFVQNILDSLTGEESQPTQVQDSTTKPRATTVAVRGATVSRPESYCLCLDAQNDHHRLLDLQRDVLPRVIRTPARLPAVQFLNASASHAVCLFTPEFACGPLPEPLTILVVGIATEDGCFVSGLQQRFELGHMYPEDAIAEATELSAVCLTTNKEVQPADAVGMDDDDSTSDECDGMDKDEIDADNDNDGDDDNYADADRIFLPNGTCDCIFKGICQKQCPALPDDDDEDDRDVPTYSNLRIHRGNTGPGAWHCYTAVADGANCVIRVDGVVEGKERLQETGVSAFLDGLTIGSDHCFDLSLCCGGGSGMAGQGAIAEVAVFSGRLDDADLQVLERQMMNKYCIKKSWSDCERQAQALFLRKQPKERIPLRYLTRNSAVAWKLFHPVTAEPMRVSRIGSTAGASSTDF